MAFEGFTVGRRNVVTGLTDVQPSIANDGVLITRDSILQWKLEGKVFYAQQGNAATRLAFTETAYDEDQPQLALRVPDGTLMIPLMLNVNYEIIPGTASHLIWSKTDNDIGAGTSTELTVANYRRDALRAPTVKANSLYTGNATAATGLVEVRRFYHPYAAAAVTDAEPKHMPWSLDDHDMPILVGPATLQAHIFATTTDAEGYGQYTWIELDANELSL